MIVIDAVDDPALAEFRVNERGLATRADKRDDDGAGLFLAEGDLVVGRALEAGCRPYRALADARRVPAVAERFAIAGGEVLLGDGAVRRLVTGLGKPHSIVGLFHRPARPSADQLVSRCRRLVIVEGVDNPANVGSIVRNAAGLGWDGLILDHTSADPLARRSLRVAMGTAFSLPHARTRQLADVVRRAAQTDLALYSLTPRGEALDLRNVEPPERCAILIGSERAGLSDDLMAITTPVAIEMTAGVDSLNAAAATAIACFALASPERSSS